MGWRVYLDLPSCVFFLWNTFFSIIFEVYVWLQECNPPIRSHHPLGSVKLGKSHNFTHWKWNFDEVWEILKCENLKQNWGFSFSLPLGLFCFSSRHLPCQTSISFWAFALTLTLPPQHSRCKVDPGISTVRSFVNVCDGYITRQQSKKLRTHIDLSVPKVAIGGLASPLQNGTSCVHCGAPYT